MVEFDTFFCEMDIFYCSVCSSCRRERNGVKVVTGEGGIVILASYKFYLSEYMIVWCKIQVIINPLLTHMALKYISLFISTLIYN